MIVPHVAWVWVRLSGVSSRQSAAFLKRKTPKTSQMLYSVEFTSDSLKMLKVQREGTIPKTPYLMRQKLQIVPLFLVQSNGKGKWREADSDWQGPLQGHTGWHIPWSTGVGFSWAAAEGYGSQENLGARRASLTHSRHIMEGWDGQIQNVSMYLQRMFKTSAV